MKSASSKNNLINSDEENENIDGQQVRACCRVIFAVSAVNVKEAAICSNKHVGRRCLVNCKPHARVLILLKCT